MPPDNPFVVHRRHLDLYRRARSGGLSDQAFVELVSAADQKVAEVGGVGFRITPLVDLTEALAGDPARPAGLDLGPVVAKVETANVAGSHKARHLFGLLLQLLIDDAPPTPLAIASCGNAALGAAVVAASAGRPLIVLVPVNADPEVVRRLHVLGAEVRPCPRQPGQTGDPCLNGLEAAMAAGARPFTVQGPLCPGVIDGARTIGLELADQLDQRQLVATALFVQVGGGALATAVMDGLARAWPDRPLPRLHPVQARSAHPYVAGWQRIAPALLARLGHDDPVDDRARAELLASLHLRLPDDLEAVAALMTPWPGTPHSVASGILDDLTYDWLTLMAHQIRTGGWPQLVDEATFELAAQLAAHAIDPAPPPDATGAAGLAGLIEAARAGTLGARDPGQTAVVLVTGVDRSSTA